MMLSAGLLLGLSATTIAPVAAHELIRDGAVGAVLHIEPDDAVFSGRSLTYEAEFEDTSNTFRLADCDCTIMASQHGHQVFSQRLTPANKDTATGSIMFTRPGDYQLMIHGAPHNGAQFKPFVLVYNETVKDPSSPTMTVVFAGLALVVATAAVVVTLRSLRR